MSDWYWYLSNSLSSITMQQHFIQSVFQSLLVYFSKFALNKPNLLTFLDYANIKINFIFITNSNHIFSLTLEQINLEIKWSLLLPSHKKVEIKNVKIKNINLLKIILSTFNASLHFLVILLFKKKNTLNNYYF